MYAQYKESHKYRLEIEGGVETIIRDCESFHLLGYTRTVTVRVEHRQIHLRWLTRVREETFAHYQNRVWSLGCKCYSSLSTERLSSRSVRICSIAAATFCLKLASATCSQFSSTTRECSSIKCSPTACGRSRTKQWGQGIWILGSAFRQISSQMSWRS